MLGFRALYLVDEADRGLARRERVCAMASGLAGWCMSKPPEAIPDLKAQAALRYCAEHMPKVAEHCRDPRVPIDNNELERRCKAFATARKNWQICDTLAGAQASACMCSLIETARATGWRRAPGWSGCSRRCPAPASRRRSRPNRRRGSFPGPPDVPDRCYVKN